jgi:predicted oxidoreductase
MRRAIEACLELGISTFDHADVYGDYGGEERFGEALEEMGMDREHLQLVTKCGIQLVSSRRPETRLKHYNTGREHLVAAVERSLRALRTDRVELLLLHRPDPLMEAEEVARAFSALRSAGKVLHFGVSNFTPAQVELLAAAVPFPLVGHQLQLSLLRTEPMFDGTLDQCQRMKMGVMAWSPLGGGRLFSRVDPEGSRVLPALEAIGREREASPDAVALAWLLAHPARVFPVLGTTDPFRLGQATRAATLGLDRQDWFQLLEAARGFPVP